MIRRGLILALIMAVLLQPVRAEPIRWVDFQVPYESLKYAMETDISSFETETHVDWVIALATAACRTGGQCGLQSVKKSIAQLRCGLSPEEILGSRYQYYPYYYAAYQGVLGGFLGSYAIKTAEGWQGRYGLKAFCPIASGYGYSHYDDFGAKRTYGFDRKHLGNDLLGSQGTPIVAVEGGTVEALGWNRYGGWRVGIRSFDTKRYYYYAHLQKDRPFAADLKVGDTVQAGDLIGFMGRTGYSYHENTENIDTVHLHFGMQLIFEEDNKNVNPEIWVDVYNLVRLLSKHRCSYRNGGEEWERIYPFVDLDVSEFVPH